MRQEPSLARKTTAIAGQGGIGPDDPVAGHNNADGVGPVGEAQRPHRLGPVYGGGQLTIATGLASRDCAKGGPDLALKFRATIGDGQAINDGQVSSKIGLDPIARGRAAG